MATLKEFDVVRLVELLSANRHYQGTEGTSRPPCVGDTGTIVAVLGDAAYCVESVAPNGCTVWLADFAADELQLVWAYPG
jgi:hypothetical protein